MISDALELRVESARVSHSWCKCVVSHSYGGFGGGRDGGDGSNLCFIVKILEKLVLSQVSSYLNSHNLYNTCQSTYRPGHSTETALLKVVNDLFLFLNKGNISVLALLDFSSAFDTIDHPILVHRLHTDIGFTDTVLQWSSSYLTDRTHYVSLSNHCSAFTHVHSGAPQGSVLGPILFTMYI